MGVELPAYIQTINFFGNPIIMGVELPAYIQTTKFANPGWFKQFLVMKACQYTITQYFGGSVKQVTLYETLKIRNI